MDQQLNPITMNKTIYLGSIIALILVSCAQPQKPKTLISPAMVKQYNLTNKDLMSLQYYIGSELEFTSSDKVETLTQKNISDNSATSKTTINRQLLTLPAMTPGVATKIEGDSSIWVDFGNNIVLEFERTFNNNGYSFPIGYEMYDPDKEYPSNPPEPSIRTTSLRYVIINGINYNVALANPSERKMKMPVDHIHLYTDLSIHKSENVNINSKTAPGRIIEK